MGIVIPKNFSQAVVSVDSPEPLKGQLEYHVDKSNNYLSGTIGDSIKRELEMNLDEKISKIYVEQIFAQLSDSVEELQKAANGAGLLAEKTGMPNPVPKPLPAAYPSWIKAPPKSSGICNCLIKKQPKRRRKSTRFRWRIWKRRNKSFIK
jgi:outer membrane biogenesis lipoprotein LolB